MNKLFLGERRDSTVWVNYWMAILGNIEKFATHFACFGECTDVSESHVLIFAYTYGNMLATSCQKNQFPLNFLPQKEVGLCHKDKLQVIWMSAI